MLLPRALSPIAQLRVGRVPCLQPSSKIDGKPTAWIHDSFACSHPVTEWAALDCCEDSEMSDKGLYDHLYEKFFQSRDKAKGYDFQEATTGSVPPPTVAFSERLRWWTWDRWRRRKKIRDERDRRLEEIIRLKKPPQR